MDKPPLAHILSLYHSLTISLSHSHTLSLSLSLSVDHSSSSTTLSYQHLRSGISGGSGPGGSAGSIPTAHVMPSTSSSSCVKLGVPGLLLSSSSVSTVSSSLGVGGCGGVGARERGGKSQA